MPGALKIHHRSCSRNKKRLAGALEKARVLWTSKKKARLETHTNGSQQTGSNLKSIGSSSTNGVEAEVRVFASMPGNSLRPS